MTRVVLSLYLRIKHPQTLSLHHYKKIVDDVRSIITVQQ